MGHGARQRPIVFSTHTPGVLTWPPPSDSQAPTFWWLPQNAIASHSTFTAMLQAPPLGRWLVLVGNGTGHRAPFRPPCPPISLLAVALIGLHRPSLRGGLHSPRLMAGFWLAMGQSTGPHFALPAPPMSLLAVALTGMHRSSLRGGLHSPRAGGAILAAPGPAPSWLTPPCYIPPLPLHPRGAGLIDPPSCSLPASRPRRAAGLLGVRLPCRWNGPRGRRLGVSPRAATGGGSDVLGMTGTRGPIYFDTMSGPIQARMY